MQKPENVLTETAYCACVWVRCLLWSYWLMFSFFSLCLSLHLQVRWRLFQKSQVCNLPALLLSCVHCPLSLPSMKPIGLPVILNNWNVSHGSATACGPCGTGVLPPSWDAYRLAQDGNIRPRWLNKAIRSWGLCWASEVRVGHPCFKVTNPQA